MISESTLKKLTTYCLHKVEVRQPFTGETILVPCGTCPACLMRKSYRNELACKANESLFKYTYFVTLTYNTACCPRYSFINTRVNPDTNRVDVIARVFPRPKLYRSVVKRTSKGLKKIHKTFIRGLSYRDSFVQEFSLNKDYFDDYCKQASLNVDGKYLHLQDYYGYLSRNDYALFMKRFRKYMFSKVGSYEKIHTYVVGEYSPKHFRPHFHILFFFDSDRFAENFGRAINQCWRFGRVDYSLSRGTATSYVAGYVNSTSRTPWHLNAFRPIRTFSRFSNGFREIFFKDEIELVKRGNFSSFIDGKEFIDNGRTWTIYPSQPVLDSCFFPFVSSNFSSINLVRSAVFSLSKLCSTIFDKTVSVTENLCRLHDSYMNNDFWIRQPDWFLLLDSMRMAYGDVFLKQETFISRFQNIISRFQKTCRSYSLNLYDYKLMLRSEDVIDRILYNSHKFKFYYERENQKNHYRSTLVTDPYLGKAFWAESEQGIKDFLNSPDGQRLEAYQFRKLDQAVKHREINDLNIKFVIPT